MSLKGIDLLDLFNETSKTASICDLNSNEVGSFTYLDEQSTQRAHSLMKLNIGLKDPVVVLAQNNLSLFVEIFSLWKIGAVPFILPANQTDDELNKSIEFVRPKALIQPNSEVKIFSDSHPLATPGNTALALFTSGTTAQPKVVLHTFESIRNRLESIETAIPKEVRAKTLCSLPLHFGHGLIGMALSSLYSGVNLFLTPALNLQNVNQIEKWMDQTNPTFISGTPATWGLILRFCKSPKLPLKRAQIASAHTGDEMFLKIQTWSGCQVYNVYGMTEAASWVSDHLYTNSGDHNNVGTGSQWKTIFRVSNIDAAGIGDIEIKTAGMMSGYWQASQIPDPIGDWFKTGDHGHFNEKNELKLLGRASRVINKGGIKISAEEVELALFKEKSIQDVVVFGAGELKSEVVALIVLNEKAIDPTQLEKEWIKNLSCKLSVHKIPTRFIYAETIPRKPNGKPNLLEIDRIWNPTTN